MHVQAAVGMCIVLFFRQRVTIKLDCFKTPLKSFVLGVRKRMAKHIHIAPMDQQFCFTMKTRDHLKAITPAPLIEIRKCAPLI